MPAKKKAAKKAAKKAPAKKAPQKGSRVPIQPLGDRVMIKLPSPEEMGTTTASGIIIPDTAQEKPEQGVVVAVGPGKIDDGVRIEPEVSVGDKVLFKRPYTDPSKFEGREYYVVREEEILGIIN